MLPVHESLRENLEDEVMSMMIYLTAAVAAFLFVYLIVALVRPEWF
jgi:K+-transporting ATPase KdpF subunit